MTSHAVSRRAIVWTWVALMLLAGLSFGLSFAHLGDYGYAVALLVAAAKATLVVVFFMELLVEPSPCASRSSRRSASSPC
jgi:caa(3)-type oxidase subunit IV